MRISSLLLVATLFAGCSAKETADQSKVPSQTKSGLTETTTETSSETDNTAKSDNSDGKSSTTESSSALAEIKDQSFDVDFETWGSVRFVSAKDNAKSSLVLSIQNKEGKTLYTLPKPDYIGSWSFDSIKAVAFKDLDNRGKKDIIVIASYIVDTDKGKKTPMDVVSIFSQTDKAFVSDFPRDVRVNNSSKVQTIKAVVDRVRVLDDLKTNPFFISDKEEITDELIDKVLCTGVLATDMAEDAVGDLYYDTYSAYHMNLSEVGQDEMYHAIGRCYASETESILRGRPALKTLTKDLYDVSTAITDDLMSLAYNLNLGGTIWGHENSRTHGIYGYRMNKFVKLRLTEHIDTVQDYNKSVNLVDSLLDKYKNDTIKEAYSDNYIEDRKDIDYVEGRKSIDKDLNSLDSHFRKLKKLLSSKDTADLYILHCASLGMGGDEI
jgi:hypothetical protein